MPTFRTTRRVNHPVDKMFDLVSDVERYPEFVPLCRSLKVRRRAMSGEGIEIVIADMTIAYKLISESFTSRVTMDRARLAILVEYLEGPFSHLENRWNFRVVDEHACEIDFFIDYDFRSRTLGLLMGAMFERVFRKLAEAFERRADIIYAQKRKALPV